MKYRRVKITGIGLVTPAGIGREAFLRSILEPISRVAAVKVGETGGLVAAAEVKDFRVGAFALDAGHLQSPRHVQFALAATVLALRDAGITVTDVRKLKPLLVMAYPLVERFATGAFSTKPSADGDGAHALQDAVADMLGARSLKFVGRKSFCSLDAIGRAAEQVASGEVELAICGGAEAPLQEEILTELKKMGLSPGHAKEPERVCRPFDLWRTTGVVGEGAGMFVIEPEASLRRGHTYVAGFSRAEEKEDRPWEPLSEVTRLALGNAGLRTAEIDCIHAEGTGNKERDLAEANGLRESFGARLTSIPVVAIKGAIGNALGAAGAIQIGCAVLAMRHSMIAPTVNWRHPDPSCPLNLSPSARSLATKSALIVGRDLGGGVSCLILRQ